MGVIPCNKSEIRNNKTFERAWFSFCSHANVYSISVAYRKQFFLLAFGVCRNKNQEHWVLAVAVQLVSKNVIYSLPVFVGETRQRLGSKIAGSRQISEL